MADGVYRALSRRPAEGVVIAPAGTAADLPPEIELCRGGHPIPNAEGIRGAHAVLSLAERLGEDDIVLLLVSGGGSALMTLPDAGLSLDDLRATTGALLKAGATIGELNTVRKHLEKLKGGRLAAAVRPARVVALVLSDVVGDPLDTIASGPVTPDPTTFADALAILERRDVLRTIPGAIVGHLERGVRGELPETPKADDPCFARVETHIVGHNRLAAEAALAEARRRGYRTHLLSTLMSGEAREVGRELGRLGLEVLESGRPVEAPAFILAAGETTVTVRGNGRGGRNQEVALGAALVLDGAEGVLVASLGTDGVDGPTDAAGALAWGSTIRRAAVLGLDPQCTLADNNAYPFFEALGDLVVTGPTGTNVMDLMMVLAQTA